jgi:Rieske Fe-S protein
MNKAIFSRRTFFKTVAAAALLWTLYVWDKMVKVKMNFAGKKTGKFPFNPNKEVDFLGDYIVVNESETTKMFSAHCTHLGCAIATFREGKFICPCHGSEFTKDGKVLKGPAYKSLERVAFTFDKEKKFIIVK